MIAMRRMIVAGWLAWMVCGAVARGAESGGGVGLRVEDRVGVKRVAEPICSGVPFGKGRLQADHPMHVQTKDGAPLPTQTKVLGRWPDGSVKWLLVQFLADCPGRGRGEYRLVRGAGLQARPALQVDDLAEGVVVETGAVRVTIPKRRLSVLGEVTALRDGRSVPVLSDGTPMTFVLADGGVHRSGEGVPESVTIEEAGPVRATVRVVGWLKGPGEKPLYKLDTRLRFYAGQPTVRADYTFICLGGAKVHAVKEIAVELAPKLGRGCRFVLPGEGQPTAGDLADGATAVLSVDPNMVCQVGVEGKLKRVEGPLDGWAWLGGDESSIGVAIQDFRHLCPKAIEASPGKIRLALWSGRAGQVLNLGRTRAKTHRVLLDFGAGKADEEGRLARLRAFQEPLIAVTDPEYFCSTDALGPLSPEGVAETAEYDGKVWACFEPLLKQRETLPLENGMLHYGDYYHGGYGNKATRGDLEYDTGHACFLLYARSGRRDYYDFAVACNQHFIDMDVNQETGDQRFHGYSEYAETHEAPTTSLEWGHVFTDCPADAYFLTGDERSLEALRMIADRTATIAEGEGYERIRGIFAGAERQLGWPLLALCRAYEVTGAPKYLEASKKIVTFVKGYAKDPLAAYGDGKWWRCWMMDGCKVFMVGALHEGLAGYYDITGDDELRPTIVKSLDWLITHMWNPEMDGFVYEFNAMNRGHRMAGMTGLNLLAVDAFRHGFELTGDKRYLAVATRAFWRQVKDMKPEGSGKQFSQDVRRSPYTAAYLYREKIDPAKLPASPRPIRQGASERPTGPRADVLLKASFEGDLRCEGAGGGKAGTAVGKIEFVEGKNGKAVAVGKEGYAWLPAPPEMLRGPGSIELWVRLHFKKRADRPGQRAVFHVEGGSPLIDSLGAVTIYSELRIRMKDHVGHLDGTAEGDIMAWKENEWHHVVVTWDERRVRLYIDGKEQTRDNEGKQAGDGVSALPGGGQTKINLGWRFGNWYCDCAIDELIVHGRALGAEEVAGTGTAAPPTAGEPVVSYWDAGVHLARIPPSVLFAAWSDGMVVKRVGRNTMTAFVASQEVSALVESIRRAGFFAPSVDILVRPDGPERCLSVIDGKKRRTLRYHERDDWLRSSGPQAYPSRSECEKLVAIWWRVVAEIKKVKCDKLKPFEGERKLVYPRYSPGPQPTDAVASQKASTSGSE
ncbi:MAG: hypothetical protein JXQ73_16535 [Phycisphaerae bacterium]|nr:hypothetical protein [Phycisphaerae bacterium]